MEEKGFVTKRVAELLRKKGFDCKVGHYYADEEDGLRGSLSIVNWNIVGGHYSAPTVQLAIDWLETKGYWIVYRPLDYYIGVRVSILATDEEDEWYDVNNITAETKYEALNKALEYCLENLIR